MRILHLLASPFWSGPAELVAYLALAQRALGHKVTVAVDRKRDRTPAEELAVPRLQAVGLLDGGGLELSVKSAPWAMLADAARLRRREVDVVHSHFSHDHYVAALGRPRGARLVRSIHAARSLRGALPRADAYTAPSSELLVRLIRLRKPVAMVLPPLVAPELKPAVDRETLRRELGLSGGPLVGMVSTFQASRRHEVGVAAFARVRERVPSARLVLVGDGALEPAVRGQVEALGLSPHVIFAGYQRGPDFMRWLQALDEVWVLGLGNDFSGRAAAQARACGVRVVAVEEGGLPALADALVEPTPEAVAASALGPERREVALPSNEEIARAVLALYERAA